MGSDAALLAEQHQGRAAAGLARVIKGTQGYGKAKLVSSTQGLLASKEGKMHPRASLVEER